MKGLNRLIQASQADQKSVELIDIAARTANRLRYSGREDQGVRENPR